jgi:transposase InsO family protein
MSLGEGLVSITMQGMVIYMNEQQLQTLEQLQAFLDGTVPIGIRRAPAPNNKPGYLRVDSVHQGDRDGLKGIYHINAVDCITQFEAVGTCERLSEAYLIPVLEELLRSFPFIIRGFHSDNGSEYINKRVAALLHKMLIEEHTKSRSRQTNDNAQAESKNGSIVRKHFGYSHTYRSASRASSMSSAPST